MKRKIDVTLGRNKKKDSKVGGAKGKAGKGPSPSRKVNEVGDKIENVNADEQKQETKKKKKKRERVGVNGKFLRRLIYILRIIIPKWNSKSFFFLLVQTLLLIARSLLSIKMAKLGTSTPPVFSREKCCSYLFVIHCFSTRTHLA